MIDEVGKLFRVTVQYDPYFYVKTVPGMEERVARYLATFNKPHEPQTIEDISVVEKEDLEMVSPSLSILALFYTDHTCFSLSIS